jgi:NADH dehydrogenase FAD-containing subunit
VLTDTATGIDRGQVLLGCGASLACDVPVIATGMQAPAWVTRSGLALDEHGFVAVDACQRSTSHAHVFAAREDTAMTGRLATHLAAVAVGTEPRGSGKTSRGLKLLSYGDGHAIASWGQHTAQGRWVGWLKHRIDRARVAKYRNDPPGNTPP